MATRYTEFALGETRYRLDRQAQALFRAETVPHPFTEQNFKLLELFLAHPTQHLITKEKVRAHLYGTSPTGDHAVDEAIKALRTQLGAVFLTTVHGKGLRFAASIRHFDEVAEPLPVAALAPLKRLPAPAPGQDDPTEPPSAEWHVTRADSYTELAVASLHRPRPFSNSDTEFVRLDATFRCKIEEYPYEKRSIAVGLREVTLAFELTSCVFAANSLLGDASRPLPGVKAGGNSITVKAEKGEMLNGSPLEGQHVADLEPTGAGLPAVALKVSAPQRGVTFAFLDADGEREEVKGLEDENKDIILNLIYADDIADRTDERDRLRLAESVVARKPTCSALTR